MDGASNIISVLDSGKAPASGKAASLLVLIQRNPEGIPWTEARVLFEGVLSELIRMKAAGCVHGDIKPSNILRLPDGSVQLLRPVSGGRSPLSPSSAAGRFGSYDYMAPEFARNQQFQGDEQSDIFSVAVCFYEALTGSVPFPRLGAGGSVSFRNRWAGGEILVPSFQHGIFRVLARDAREFIRRGFCAERSLRHGTFEAMLLALRGISPRILSGRDEYEMLQVLGSGGFGEVYGARRRSDGRPLAVKWLFPGIAPRRFLKEARLLERFRHDHIVEYVDMMEMTDGVDMKQYFLVMELLDGMPGWTLRNRIRRRPGGLALREVVELFIHYLEALDYLHGRKIIHRDIKPSNLYAPEGNPAGAKVFDLGIARDIHGTTTTGFVPGTLEYMAPELAAGGGERGSPSSDIYALGISLYEALTGRPAFQQLPDNEEEAFLEFRRRAASSGGRTVDCKLEPLASRPDLVRVVIGAIAVKPADRFASAHEMLDALMAVGAGLGIDIMPGGCAVRDRDETVYEAAQGVEAPWECADSIHSYRDPPGRAGSSYSPSGISGLSPGRIGSAGRGMSKTAFAAATCAVIAAAAGLMLLRKGHVPAIPPPADTVRFIQPAHETAGGTGPGNDSGKVAAAQIPCRHETPGAATGALCGVARPAAGNEAGISKTKKGGNASGNAAMRHDAGAGAKEELQNAPAGTSAPAAGSPGKHDTAWLSGGRQPAALPQRTAVKIELAGEMPVDPPVAIGLSRADGTVVNCEILGNFIRVDSGGEKAFVMSRADYEPETVRIVIPAGAEMIRMELPAAWRPGPELLRLLRAEEEPAGGGQGVAGSEFAISASCFRWPGHAQRCEAARRAWAASRARKAAGMVEDADRAADGFIKWLYEVADPAKGTRRANVEKPPDIAFELPRAGELPEGRMGDMSRAKLARLGAWKSCMHGMGNEPGRRKLAGELLKISSRPDAWADEVARCRFEAAVLMPAAAGADDIPEFASVKAHRMYEPGEPALDLLKEMEAYCAKGGRPDEYDLRLAAMAAHGSWRNAVAGDEEYAKDVAGSLARILSCAGAKQADALVKYLASTADSDAASGIFMIEAIAGLKDDESEVRRAATRWLETGGNTQAGKDARRPVAESLNKLRSMME